STRKQLDEYGDKISDDNKKAIEDALETLEKAHKEENMDEIDSAIEAVNQAWSGASEEIYKATQEEAAAGGAAGPEGAAGAANGAEASEESDEGDDAVDADYEVVDDEDKK
ncbi:MAG TPA: molecular chaperone DnaK, partial [Balneolaceae bacterium]|nr:molecular chaperone DnaK [Balneolaceae bacterium]